MQSGMFYLVTIYKVVNISYQPSSQLARTERWRTVHPTKTFTRKTYLYLLNCILSSNLDITSVEIGLQYKKMSRYCNSCQCRRVRVILGTFVINLTHY